MQLYRRPLPPTPGIARLVARAERAWVHAALQTAQKDICYFTRAGAQNWLIGLRKISLLGRTGKSMDTVHRVENAGHYLLVKRYIAEMQRILSR